MEKSRDSGDAGDAKKRDREKWRGSETLGTLGTGKKETERNREVRKRAGKFKIQIQTVGGRDLDSRDAGDAKKRDREKWSSPKTLGTLGTRKNEKQRNRGVRKRAGKFKFEF